MQIKNMKLKDYYDKIAIKLLATHMLCRENFWKSKKLNVILNNIKVVVVYNDALNNGDGVNRIADSLNKMKPYQGELRRCVKALEQFAIEEEFEERYVDTGYCSELEIWAEVE